MTVMVAVASAATGRASRVAAVRAASAVARGAGLVAAAILWTSRIHAAPAASGPPLPPAYVDLEGSPMPADPAIVRSAASAAAPGHLPSDPPTNPSADLCARPTGWKRFACDSRYLGTRLLLQEPGDAERAAFVLGTAGVLYVYRVDTQNWIQDHQGGTRPRLDKHVRDVFVSPWTSTSLAAALFLGGKLSHESYHVESAQVLLESMLLAGVIAGTGQTVLSSERPRDGKKVHFFRTGGHGVSGDVTLAASIVAPIDRRYLRIKAGDDGWTKLFKVAGRSVLYAGVGLTALERMDTRAHWAPDVFLGAANGFTAGNVICSAHEPAQTSSGLRPSSALRPAVYPIPGGLIAAWRF